MTAVRNCILGTAGHVDHGKSALVRALTGTDPDRLPEEKARGITIDLGFANLRLGDFNIGIVDVPGHEDFVRNAASGIAFMNAVLFVVAANEGWMPQSEEHFQILEYLDVKRGLFVITKSDLAAGECALPRADWPVVKVSALTGEGVEDLKQAILAVLRDTPPPADIEKPRLHVDRAFTLKGVGTIVTGTLTGGTLKRGDKVVIQPVGINTRARALHNHGSEVEMLGAGARCAINLADVAAETIQRGYVVTRPGMGGPDKVIDALFTVSPRAKTRLRHNQRVSVCLGSGHWPARLALFETKELGPGEKAVGQLRFEEPVYCHVGDRFILRETTTLAGGLVLDADARQGGAKTSRVASLANTSDGRIGAAELILSWLRHDGIVPREKLLVKSHLNADLVNRTLRELGAKVGETFVGDAPLWKQTLERVAVLIDAVHRDHPERPGLMLTELQAALGAGQNVFAELLHDLCAGGEFVRDETVIRRGGHKPIATGELNTVAEALLKRLAADPFNTPRRKECDPQALRYLHDAKRVIEFGTDEVLLRESYEETCRRVSEFLRQRGQATVAELRDLLKSNRRIMVPLLEKMDKDGVTVRIGDVRKLKSAAP